MQKLELNKIDDLADIFCAIMGGRPDGVEEIKSFMEKSPLKQLMFASDIDRIIEYDGFFAEEVIDAVYSLLPVKIPLDEHRKLVLTPQAFRKLNAAKVSRPASRIINISFPKATEVYKSHFETKFQRLVEVIHEIQQKKKTQMDEQTALRITSTEKPSTNAPQEAETPKPLPPIVVARLKKVAEEKKNKKTPERETTRNIKYLTKKDIEESSMDERLSQRKAKRKIYMDKYRTEKKAEEEKKKAELTPEELALIEKEKKRQRKQKRELNKALKEQEKRREQRELLKQQQKEENERLIAEEQQRNEEEKKRKEKKQNAKKKRLEKTNPKLAEKREKNRLRMQKRRAENPEARKSYYVKYDDLPEEEREKKRQANRERNRRYREAHRLEIRKSHNERRARLKAENPELLKEMDRANNKKANRKETCHNYYQNHKEEVNRRTRENPMRKIYNQRYKEKKQRLAQTGPVISSLLVGILNAKLR